MAPLEARGAVGVEMLREDRDAETEFVTISYWESVEAMTGGSGADPTRPHHLPDRVQILTILETRGQSAVPF